MTVPERFRSLTSEVAGPCVLWLGAVDRHGYGKFYAYGRTLQAHRVSYELAIGPIPEGLVIDHLCRNRECVNPAHLEPVTFTENIRRGRHGYSGKRPRAFSTHCGRGHEMSGDNLGVTPKGKRWCKACTNLRARERRERLRAAEVVA